MSSRQAGKKGKKGKKSAAAVEPPGLDMSFEERFMGQMLPCAKI